MTRRIRITPLLLVIAMLFAACGGDSPSVPNDGVSIETAPVSITGSALAPADTNNSTGQIAPGFVAQSTHSAQPIAVDTADGTVRLVGFFAHWCPHCQNEVPMVSDYLSSNDLPDGVEVTIVSTSVSSSRDNYPPSEWFDREEFPATVYVDSPESEIAAAYGLTNYPYWVMVAGDGSVLQQISGSLTADQLDSLVQFAGDQAG